MEISRSIKASAFGLTLFLVAGIALPMFSPLAADANHTQCSDAVDNDGDGRIDYPQDPDCTSIDDQTEGILGDGGTGVFLSVTDGRDEVSPGDSVTYIITLRQARDDSREIDVDFHLPAQARIANAGQGGRITSTGVRWDNVTVYKNNVRTLTVEAYLLAGAEQGQLIVARASAEGTSATDTSLVKNSATAPYPAPRVTVSISDGRTNAEPGDVLDYTVTVRNPTSRTMTEDLTVNVGGNLEIDGVYNGGIESGRDAIWRSLVLPPQTSVTLHLRGVVEPHVRRMAFVDASARYGTVTAVDRTVIGSDQFPSGQIDISLSDGLSRADRGQTLTYVVRIYNRADTVESHAYVTASIPLYTQFVAASDGASWDGNNVRWQNLVLPAHTSLEMRYSVRVRSDAPRNAVLSAGAEVKGGASATDKTGLDEGTFVYGNSLLAVASPASSKILFRKSADRAEVLPGDRITYTLYVRNNFGSTLTNVTVTDKFDPAELTLLSVSDNAQVSPSSIRWIIPSLRPGESWEATYAVTVNPNIARGIRLSSSTTIAADQLASRTVANTVYTLRTTVMGATPKTGASDFVAALESTAQFLSPMTSGSAGLSLASFVSVAAGGIGAGLKTGRRFL